MKRDGGFSGGPWVRLSRVSFKDFVQPQLLTEIAKVSYLEMATRVQWRKDSDVPCRIKTLLSRAFLAQREICDVHEKRGKVEHKCIAREWRAEVDEKGRRKQCGRTVEDNQVKCGATYEYNGTSWEWSWRSDFSSGNLTMEASTETILSFGILRGAEFSRNRKRRRKLWVRDCLGKKRYRYRAKSGSGNVEIFRAFGRNNSGRICASEI